MSTQLGQIAKKAKLDRKARFTSLAHLLNPAFLKETWGMMNRKAASGIDGESTEQFASELEERVEEICKQLKAGTYRAPPDCSFGFRPGRNPHHALQVLRRHIVTGKEP
jgi:RNA-directed DNA polymerase